MRAEGEVRAAGAGGRGRPCLTLGRRARRSAIAGGAARAAGCSPTRGERHVRHRARRRASAPPHDDHKHFGGDAVVDAGQGGAHATWSRPRTWRRSAARGVPGGQVLVANQQLASFTPAAPGSKRGLRRLQQPLRQADDGHAGPGRATGRARSSTAPSPRSTHRSRATADRGTGRRSERPSHERRTSSRLGRAH